MTQFPAIQNGQPSRRRVTYPGARRYVREPNRDFLASIGGNRLVLIALGLACIIGFILAVVFPPPQAITVRRGHTLIESVRGNGDTERALRSIQIAEESRVPVFLGRGTARHEVTYDAARAEAAHTGSMMISVVVPPGATFRRARGVFSHWRYIPPAR